MAPRFFLGIPLLVLLATLAAADDPKGLDFFEKRIRPVLVEHCYECHSADSKKLGGNLRLDIRDGWVKGGESGPALIVGEAKKSLLIQAIKHDGLEMPPKNKLPAEVIADFEKWIQLGAPDPRIAAGIGPQLKTKAINWDEARKFWSFQPIAKPAVPQTKHDTWSRTDVDRFIYAKLQGNKLKPVADANKLTLIRRLSFDLIGLPPTPEEVDAFLADSSPQAVESLVDRLLASPHFGERWGRHWLDVARYAESNGNVDNFLFPHAWRYRDYVISAFNADKPYDRFLTEQIAGDLLPADDVATRNSQLTATGFLALTSKPRPQNNPDYALDLVAEQIDVLTVATMGLTVTCARCHDHKFDPIPQSEFYSLAAIFESSEMLHGAQPIKQDKKGAGRGGLHTLTMAAGAGSQVAHEKEAQTDVKKVKQAIEDLLAPAKERAAARLEIKRKALLADNPKLDKAKLEKRLEKFQERIEETLSNEEKAELGKLREQLAQLQQPQPEAKPVEAAGYAMGLTEGRKPVEGKIRIRGEAAKIGDAVPRGFVTVGCVGTPPTVSATQSGRLELAQWITSRDNPLTARVMANRIWRHLFGRGLVPTVDNFGALGEQPTHPELLDYLATQFRDDGWSVKRMIRSLVLTRTYQLAATSDPKSFEIDPDNTFNWRHAPRRLEGEALRDAMLLAAGNLNREPATASPVSKEGNVEVKNGTERKFANFESKHRSVYLPIVRNAEPEMLVTFDLPDTELVVGDRSVTTVPAQSLFLLNSPWVVEQARGVAAQVLAKEGIEPAARVNWAYRLVLNRPATGNEVQRTLGFIETTQARLADKSDAAEKRAWESICQSLFAAAEFRYVD
jgi:uncharacterized protein (DUF2267 family)